VVFFAAVFFAGDLRADDFFAADFFAGTFASSLRASESPIAIACLRLFTVLPDLPLLSWPRFFSCIAFSTLSEAFLPYVAMCVSRRCRQLLQAIGVPSRSDVTHQQ
jgi:hypothetical protein